MNRVTKRILLAALLVIGIIVGIPVAVGALKDQQIKVSYHNIKVVVNGKLTTPTTEPFIYSGSTFVPLRAIAEALNKKVGFDAKTYTVTVDDIMPQFAKKAVYWVPTTLTDYFPWRFYEGNHSNFDALLMKRGYSIALMKSARGETPSADTKIIITEDPSPDITSTLYSRVRDGSNAIVFLSGEYSASTSSNSKMAELFGVAVSTVSVTSDLTAVSGNNFMPPMLNSLQIACGTPHSIAGSASRNNRYLDAVNSNAKLIGSVPYSDGSTHPVVAVAKIGTGKCMFVLTGNGFDWVSTDYSASCFLSDNYISAADNAKAAEGIADWLAGLRDDF